MHGAAIGIPRRAEEHRVEECDEGIKDSAVDGIEMGQDDRPGIGLEVRDRFFGPFN